MITAKLQFGSTDPIREFVVPAGAEALKRVTEFFWGAVQTALNVPNTGERVRAKKGRPGFTYYPNPSTPGEPPHKITGHGAGSVIYEFSPDGLTSRVGLLPSAIYMLWLEFGIPGGKTITPRTKKALRWVDRGGNVRFAKRVTQGAIKARPWLFKTLERVLPQLNVLAGQ
jgi:hypothetical protein